MGLGIFAQVELQNLEQLLALDHRKKIGTPGAPRSSRRDLVRDWMQFFGSREPLARMEYPDERPG
jgi:hypothetical protein